MEPATKIISATNLLGAPQDFALVVTGILPGLFFMLVRSMVADALGVADVRLEPAPVPGFDPAASARVLAGGRAVGVVGASNVALSATVAGSKTTRSAAIPARRPDLQ